MGECKVAAPFTAVGNAVVNRTFESVVTVICIVAVTTAAISSRARFSDTIGQAGDEYVHKKIHSHNLRGNIHHRIY